MENDSLKGAFFLSLFSKKQPCITKLPTRQFYSDITEIPRAAAPLQKEPGWTTRDGRESRP